MTIDQGADTSRYQGMVALEGGSLEDAAHEYFKSRSRSRPACGSRSARRCRRAPATAGAPAACCCSSCPRRRSARACPICRPATRPEGTPAHVVAEDDAWVEGRAMIGTVEDVELLDPALSSERLVYRLFHERGVRVFKSVPIAAQCSCSRDGVEAMLRNFSQDDRDHMVENGRISVTCEFCSANYQFAPDEVRPDAARDGTGRRG